MDKVKKTEPGVISKIINDAGQKAGAAVSNAAHSIGDKAANIGEKAANMGSKISENSNELVRSGGSLLDQSAMDDQRTRELANAMVNGMMVDAGGNSGSALDGLENAMKSSTRAAASMCLAWVTYCSSQGKLAFGRVATTGSSVLPLLGIGTLRAIAKSRGDKIGGFNITQYESTGTFLGKSYMTTKVDFNRFIEKNEVDSMKVQPSRRLLGEDNATGSGSRITAVLVKLPKNLPDTSDPSFGNQFREATSIAYSECDLFDKQIVEALLNADNNDVNVKLLGALGNGSNADKLNDILQNPNTKSPIGSTIIELKKDFESKIRNITTSCTRNEITPAQALEQIREAVKTRMNAIANTVQHACGADITDIAEFNSLHTDKFRNMSDAANLEFEQNFKNSEAWLLSDPKDLTKCFSDLAKETPVSTEELKKTLSENKETLKTAAETYSNVRKKTYTDEEKKSGLESTDLKVALNAKFDADSNVLKAELELKNAEFTASRRELAPKAMSGSLTKEDVLYWKGYSKEQFAELAKSNPSLYKEISADLDKKVASINGQDTPQERLHAFYKVDQREYAELVDSSLAQHYKGSSKSVFETVDSEYRAPRKALTSEDRMDCLRQASEKHIQVRADLNNAYLKDVGKEFEHVEGNSLDGVGKANVVKTDLLTRFENELGHAEEFSKDPKKLASFMNKAEKSVCVIDRGNGTAELVVDLKALPEKYRQQMKDLCDHEDFKIGLFSGDITKFNGMYFSHAAEEIKEYLKESQGQFKDARFSLSRDESGALHVSTFSKLAGAVFTWLQGKGIKGEKTDVLEGRIYEENELLKLSAQYGQDVKRVTLPSSNAMDISWADRYSRDDPNSPINAVKDIYSRLDLGADRQANVSIAFSKNKDGGWDLLCTGSYEHVGQWLAGALKGVMPDMGTGGFKIGQKFAPAKVVDTSTGLS